MKDSEFIELLNLYLDHEISAADAARLEAEVQNNPERRMVYQQYCRMQKACRILATDFAGEPSAAPAGKKVVAFDPDAAEVASARRKRMGNFYTIGTFAAAAACVAIVFVGRSRQAAAEQASLALQSQEQAATATIATSPENRIEVKSTAVAASDVSTGPRSLGSQPAQNSAATLVANPLLLTGNAQADAVMAAAMQQAKSQFAWIDNVQLAPIQQPVPLTELRFETTPAMLRPEGRALGGRQSTNANAEMSAFQFVK